MASTTGVDLPAPLKNITGQDAKTADRPEQPEESDPQRNGKVEITG